MSVIREGAVAVITGAASGIGYALAEEALRQGMHVVVSDIREDALEAAREKLAGQGAQVHAVVADVTSEAAIEALVDKAVAKFGKINLLVNNAGAFVANLAWETSAAEMDWIIDLNFKSIAHGIRAAVPKMIAQGDECHVATVASAAGISVYPGYASYSSSKHAALAITEALYLDLQSEGIDTIGVTVIMPGMVHTDIMVPEKTSPAQLALDPAKRRAGGTVGEVENTMLRALDHGIPPEELARQVFAAIAAGQLYVLPNHDGAGHQALVESIAHGRASGTNPWPAIAAASPSTMFGGMKKTENA